MYSFSINSQSIKFILTTSHCRQRYFQRYVESSDDYCTENSYRKVQPFIEIVEIIAILITKQYKSFIFWLLLHGTTQNFIYKILIIRNNTDTVCMNIAHYMVLLCCFSQQFLRQSELNFYYMELHKNKYIKYLQQSGIINWHFQE